MQANIQIKKVVRIEKDTKTKEGVSTLLHFTFENGYELRIPLEHIDFVGINFEGDNEEPEKLEDRRVDA